MVNDHALLAPRDAQPLYLRNKVALTTAERMAAAGVNAGANADANAGAGA